MNLSQENRDRIEFKNILLDLAKDQTILKNPNTRSKFYSRLEKLYCDKNGGNKFRHFYSDVFSVLTQIQQNNNFGNINILGQNLDIIRKNYEPITYDISCNINKLYDHVNLDISRINYSVSTDDKIIQEDSIRDINKKVNEIQNEINNVETDSKNTIRKLEKSEKEYISLLAIFSSIVLAFTGGLTFSTSVLNNIHKVSIYRLIILSLLIGFVLINIIYILLFFLNKLINNKSLKKYPIIIVNIIILLSIIVTLLAWNYGLVENRNKRFIQQHSINPIIELSIESKFISL